MILQIRPAASYKISDLITFEPGKHGPNTQHLEDGHNFFFTTGIAKSAEMEHIKSRHSPNRLTITFPPLHHPFTKALYFSCCQMENGLQQIRQYSCSVGRGATFMILDFHILVWLLFTRHVNQLLWFPSAHVPQRSTFNL